MEALKMKVEEIMFNQNHILNAVKYLQERIEDIEKKKSDKADTKNSLEHQALAVKNADEIKLLIDTKEENCAIIELLDDRIKVFEEEIKSIKKSIKDEEAVQVNPKSERSLKLVECNTCGKTFKRFSDLEHHIKVSHVDHQGFKCDICKKSFILKWRLQKHVVLHNNQNITACHFFNNEKICPFEEFGCKFLHIIYQSCKFGKTCQRIKCPYRHIQERGQCETTDNGINQNDDITNDMEETDFVEDDINFVTSTPKKRKYRCEECQNTSQCVECFVNQVNGSIRHSSL